jgi:hypothetical protein
MGMEKVLRPSDRRGASFQLAERPPTITETVEKAKANKGVILRVPKAISKPNTERIGGVIENVGYFERKGWSPLDNIDYEVATVDGKAVDIWPSGISEKSFEILNKTFSYSIKITTRVSEPAPQGWRLEG